VPARKGSGVIYIAGVQFPTDMNVVNFRDRPGWHAELPSPATRKAPFRKRNLAERDLTYPVAKTYIRQLVVHLDGCIDADMCWNVLQNERGLSCHFILDNDGTLYQTLDLMGCAYHAAGMNETSIGIEICNRGDAQKYRGDYARKGLKARDEVTCFIHGEKYVALDFTREQYATMDALAKFLSHALPGIKPNEPKLWTTIVDERIDPSGALLRESYTGYLGHYHITKHKWDPGPFDFTRLVGKLRGRSAFPIGLHGLAKKQEVPEDAAALETATQAFYRNNEEEGGVGFFPVGPPFEPFRLWHGGVHLHLPEGENVYAAWPGAVVAARNVPNQPGIASVSFVLLHHAFQVKGVNLEFFTLYFHLAHETDDQVRPNPAWMKAEQWPVKPPADPQRPVVFKQPVPVRAGDVVGHIGLAGPDAEPQVHFEIFATDHAAVRKLDKTGFWTLVAGEDTRFCDARANKQLVDEVDRNRPHPTIDRSELEDFFREGSAGRDGMRRLVTLHPSEWSNAPDWVAELSASPEMAKKNRKEIVELVKEQVLPTLFWEDVYVGLGKDAARDIGFTRASNVYTYHPITFLRWLNQLQLEERVAAKNGIAPATDADRKDAAEGRTGKAKMDLDDTDGVYFANAYDRNPGERVEKIDLEELIDGFGD
jgi:N-acetyl-anhydromuramyl-L-alanine amidase AmpD